MFGYTQLIEIAELGLKGDKSSLVSLLQKIALDEIKKKKHSSYTAILDLIDKYGKGTRDLSYSSFDYSAQTSIQGVKEAIWLSKDVQAALDIFVQYYKKKLPLDPRLHHLNRILLYGPPGTGKTTLGFQIAKLLDKEVLYVKISDVISSRFGETLKNISDLFTNSKEEVIFIDEFDAFAKSRTDAGDVGELKRIVNSLIQTLDFHAQGKTVIVATNLIESIDSAILRRFAFKIHVGYLNQEEALEFLDFLVKNENQFKIDLDDTDVKFLNDLLKFQTIDEIRVLFDKVFISAHVGEKYVLTLEDFLNVAFRDNFLVSGNIKSLKRRSPALVAQLCKRLESKGIPKNKIANYLGIHRNSYNNYAQEV